MNATTEEIRTYRGEIKFWSSNRFLGEEKLLLTATETRIQAVASAAAKASPHSHSEIRNAWHTMTITPVDPDHPDPAPIAMKPVCPHCGADELVHDACVRWDDAAGTWAITTIYDAITCDHCGAEADNLAHWVPSNCLTAPDAYARSLANALSNPTLAGNVRFRQFCRDHYMDLPLSDAVASWPAVGMLPA